MMPFARPTIATIVFVLFLGPGPFIGLVPWLLSGWQLEEPLLGWGGFRWLGAVLVALGLTVLIEAIVRFVRAGGTPAPIMPTDRLVVTGLYRYVRNPMYLGAVSMILGQGLLFGGVSILIYGVAAALAFYLFVALSEEPTLRKRFGPEYEAYCRAVPRWLPRLTPWMPPPV